MTSENGMPQGFTSHGRPVTTLIIETTYEESEQPHKVDDVYTLIGANYQAVAENLKTYVFARSAALRWSRTLGEPIALYRHGAVEIDGAMHDALVPCVTISAHAMSAAEFARASLDADLTRLENVVHELRATEMDVRAAREDAESALANITALAGLTDMPGQPIADMARAAAEMYETLGWFTLIASDDADMLAELTARPE